MSCHFRGRSDVPLILHRSRRLYHIDHRPEKVHFVLAMVSLIIRFVRFVLKITFYCWVLGPETVYYECKMFYLGFHVDYGDVILHAVF